MQKRILLSLSCLLLTQGIPSASAQKLNDPIIKQGRQTEFAVTDIQGNSVAKIVASNRYQIALLLPYPAVSVGINAAQQSNLMATIDESDGRVVYLDVMATEPQGVATVHIRLDSGADQGDPQSFGGTATAGGGMPTIVTFIVELSKADANSQPTVLTYKINPPRPPAPAQEDLFALPQVSAERQPVKPVGQVLTGVNNGIQVEMKRVDTQSGLLMYDYTITGQAGLDHTYVLNGAQLRVQNQTSPATVELIPGQASQMLAAGGKLTGQLKLPASAIQSGAFNIVMFKMDSEQRATPRYIGVILE